jgi:hypothetical protein
MFPSGSVHGFVTSARLSCDSAQATNSESNGLATAVFGRRVVMRTASGHVSQTTAAVQSRRPGQTHAARHLRPSRLRAADVARWSTRQTYASQAGDLIETP